MSQNLYEEMLEESFSRLYKESIVYKTALENLSKAFKYYIAVYEEFCPKAEEIPVDLFMSICKNNMEAIKKVLDKNSLDSNFKTVIEWKDLKGE
jgi:hypothetical protein